MKGLEYSKRLFFIAALANKAFLNEQRFPKKKNECVFDFKIVIVRSFHLSCNFLPLSPPAALATVTAIVYSS